MYDPRHVLGGLVLSDAERAGYYVEACLNESNWHQLVTMPGVHHSAYHGKWFMPAGIVRMGSLGGGLLDYEPHPVETTPSGLKLREHQRRAVTFMMQTTPKDEGCILAADTGLGKTIATMQRLHLGDLLDKPGVICAPSSGFDAWCGENSDPRLHYGLEPVSLKGTEKTFDPAVLKTAKTVYLNYAILGDWWAWIAHTLKPAWIVFDELHLLCHDTARTRAAHKLSAAVDTLRLGLTATPLPCKRLELWSQLVCVQPRQWGLHRVPFGVRYCNGQRADHRDGGYWVFDGETNTAELRARLSGTLLRYTKAEPCVVKDTSFPSLKLHNEPIELSFELLDEHGYYDIERKIVAESKETDGSEGGQHGTFKIRALNEAISMLSKLKLDPALPLINKWRKKHEKVVIFTQRVATAHSVLEQISCRDWYPCGAIFGPIDGSVTKAKRHKITRQFAETKGPAVIVCTLGTSAMSLNPLKCASCAIFLDLYWNPSTLLQAIGRIHRDGSIHKKIDAVFLVASKTVDDAFCDKLRQKSTETASVMTNDRSGLQLTDMLSPSSGTEGNKSSVASILETINGLIAAREEMQCLTQTS